MAGAAPLANPFPAPAAAPPAPAGPGWGFVVRFDSVNALINGLILLEGTRDPFELKGVRVLVSKSPRFFSDVPLARPWPELNYAVIKKTLETQTQVPEMAQPVLNEFRRLEQGGKWLPAFHELCRGGDPAAITAECERVIRAVIGGDYTFEHQFFPELTGAEPGPAAAAAGGGGPLAALYPGKRLLTVQAMSDAFKGTVVSDLQANDEIFVKITDETPLGAELREALGAVDPDGDPLPVCVPVAGITALDNRGNTAVVVRLSETVYGVSEVYRSVKLKTIAALVHLPPAAGDDAATARAEDGSPLPWLIFLLGLLALAGASWYYFTFLDY